MYPYLRAWGRLVRIAAFVLAATPLSSEALDYAASIGYEGEYVNNASRSPEGGEDSDIIHRPHFNLSAAHNGPALTARLQYRAQQRIYQDDTFDEETVLEGNADVAWNVIPGRLVVFASNQRQETEIRSAGQAVPANLQETQQTSAGVNITLDAFSNHNVALGYQYSDTRNGRTDNDSNRHTVTSSYLIPLSETDVVSLIGEGSRVYFDDPLAPDYDAVTGSVQYHRQTTKLSTMARVGYQSTDRELSRDPVDGYVGEIALTRQLTGASSVGVSYARDIRDNSLEFGRRFADARLDDGIVEGFVGDTDINEVYKEQRVSVDYATELGVNTLGISVVGTRRSYEDALRDTDSVGATARLGRQIRQNLSARLSVGYRFYDFADTDQQDDEIRADLGLFWQRTPRLDLGLRLRYFTRDRTGAQDGTVDDWGAAITIDYVILGAAQR